MILINNSRELGIALKQLRKEKGLTTNDLANLVGVSRSFLSQVETAKRNASTELLRKIAEAVDVSYVDLLKIAGHNDLIDLYNARFIDAKRQSSNELIHLASDMKVLLEQTNLLIKAEQVRPTFNGHTLTPDEADRALAMLYLLFPHYKEPKI
ncbi:helix-turn-helix transcriptional regulator [Lysinibacillus fusiformis]|uniref:helix-turn-helix domain-containing protein n=1 Tax=Lysinibacillus fusiformis TaxID=28031 RepID=UPI002EC4D15E|nr:helix-turn-helix transcriptional regulator [Lysinibacillus fusiformis]